MTLGTLKIKDSTGRQSNGLTIGDFLFPATPTTLKPKLGGTGIDNTEFNAFQSAITAVSPPGLLNRRTFDGSSVPASFAASKMGPEATSGRTQVWSWKPNVPAFPTDTATHSALTAFWNTFPWSTLTEVYITLYHEPEDNIAAGTFTVAQFKAAINKLADLVSAYGQPKLKVCFILMGAWTFDSTSSYSAYDFVTGWNLPKIHAIGLDPYRFKQSEPSMEIQLTQPNYGRSNPPAGQKSPLAALLPLGLPFLLPEWASTESAPVTQAQKAQWITDAYAWMKAWNAAHQAQSILHAQYFNTDNFANTGAQPTATWALDTAVTLDAFKAAVADSRT